MNPVLASANPRLVDDNFMVAGQITPEQVAAIAEAGFRTVICNRPDNEEGGQPPVASIRTAVEAAGMTFLHIPVMSGGMTLQDVEALAAKLPDMAMPAFAYCRSGARSTQLYTFARRRVG